MIRGLLFVLASLLIWAGWRAWHQHRRGNESDRRQHALDEVNRHG